MKTKNLKAKNGFTLVELLIVIAIIGILFVVLISKVNPTTEKAKVTGVKTDFRSFYLATESVAKNYDQSSLTTFSGFVTALNDSIDKRLAFDAPEDSAKVTYCKAGDPWGTKYTLAYKNTEDMVEVLFSSNAGGNTSLDESFSFGHTDAEDTKNQAVLTLAMGIKNNKVFSLKETDNTALVVFTTDSDIKDASSDEDSPTEEKYPEPGLYSADGTLVKALTFAETGKKVHDMNLTIADDSSIVKVVLPNGVTSIGKEAFSGCTCLTSVTIPDGVTSIGVKAFDTCTSLTSVTIPNSVTDIDINAFSECTSLTSVTIPSRVTSIGEQAFNGCTGLTSVTIPSSVTSIGENAFLNVPNIKYSGSASGSPWGALSISK